MLGEGGAAGKRAQWPKTRVVPHGPLKIQDNRDPMPASDNLDTSQGPQAGTGDGITNITGHGAETRNGCLQG